MHEPDVVYEVTTRTIGGRYLLRPSELVNALIVGVIGFALERCPAIKIYGAVFLSNHATWLISSSDPAQIAEFMKAVNEYVSKEVGHKKVNNWSGTMWGRRYDAIPVIGEAALVDRMKYLLSQGCKEGLVWTPFEWPGVSCVRALLGKRPLRGVWYDRTAYGQAKATARRNQRVQLEDFATPYEIEFSPLPCWAHLSREEYRAAIRSLVDQISEETRKQHRRVLGAKKILAMNPHDAPEDFEPSPKPLCHAPDKATRTAFRERLGGFVATFRAASELLLQGLRAVFPLYSYPPAAPMVIPLT